MSGEYKLRPAANDNLEAIVDYLAERRPIAAVRFLEAAQARFEHVACMPRAHPTVPTNRTVLWGSAGEG